MKKKSLPNKIIFLITLLVFCAACASKEPLKNQYLKESAPVAEDFAQEIEEENPSEEPEDEKAVKQYVWVEAPCSEFALPMNDFKGLSCKKADENLFCAFFENGRPFYCSAGGGHLAYQLNQWGSSLTVTAKDFESRPFLLYYYANGKLARFEGADYYEGQEKAKVWFEENQIRVYIYDLKDKIKDKYYFPYNKPYIHYPGGNDMAEVNGEWEISSGSIFKDNKHLLRLPSKSEHTPPDTCEVFAGACQPSKPSK